MPNLKCLMPCLLFHFVVLNSHSTTDWLLSHPNGMLDTKDFDIATDSGGAPHIAYLSDSHLVYAYWTGSQWSKTNVTSLASTPQGFGGAISLKLDSNQTPHIAFHEGTGSAVLEYAHIEEGSWVTEMVDTAAFRPLLFIRPDNTICILDKNSNRLYLSELLDGSWNRQEITEASIQNIEFGAAMDSAGRIHVCFSNNDSDTLNYVYENENSWVRDTSISSFFFSPQIAIDSDGVTHLVYREKSESNFRMVHTKGTPGNWTTSIVIPNQVTSVSMTPGPHDKLYVLVDSFLYQYNGNTWHQENPDVDVAFSSSPSSPILQYARD